MPDYQVYNPINNPVLTFEKGGNCDNCAQCGSLNCFVCCAKCQSHAWMHNGDVPSTYAPKKICCSTIDHWEFENTPGLLDTPRPNAFAHAVVPIRGGMCTPTVNVMERDQKGNEIEFAVVQGPTFFGGCMDLCCSTKFTVSRQGDKSADLALITKKNKDPGCMGLCVALCTPADTYNLDFAPGHNLTPTQKAAIVGEMIHLDFLFFEAGNGRNGLGWERGWERRCCFVFCAWIDFGVFFFFFAKNNRCVKAMTVGAPSCCVPAIAWDVCAPANCFFQEARVKVGRINIVRPGKKEKEVLREANGLYITRTTYHTVWYV